MSRLTLALGAALVLSWGSIGLGQEFSMPSVSPVTAAPTQSQDAPGTMISPRDGRQIWLNRR